MWDLAANRQAARRDSKTVPESKRQVMAKTNARSRLSNGYALPRSVDLRSKWARRYKDLLVLHVNDLGGWDLASQAEIAILKTACCLIVELERMTERFALKGKAELAELETFQRCGNSMNRLLAAVGLQRRSRDVTPTLSDLLRADQEHQRQRSADEQDAEATAARAPP